MNEFLMDFDELPLTLGYLDRLQKGVWLDAVMWCRATQPERKLPLDHDDVAAVLGITSAAERKALHGMLLRGFEHEPDGWRRKPFLFESARKLAARQAANERRAAHNAHKARVFAQCRERGLNPSFRARVGELEALLNGSGKTTRDDEDHDESHSRRNDETDDESHDLAPVPLVSSLRSETLASLAARASTQAGEVCKAMRACGLQAVNPSHPDLLVLIEAGVGVEEFRMAAAEAVARGKGFAYALATVRGRREDAARRGPVTAAVDLLAQVAPGIAAMRAARAAGLVVEVADEDRKWLEG